MPIPIICLDRSLLNFASRFRRCFTKPQYQYFVTILMGLMLCQQTRTLSGLIDSTANEITVSGLSRFFSLAPWSAQQIADSWFSGFCEQMLSLVNKEHERQRQEALIEPKKRGRRKMTVVIGYLIGDDSTLSKKKGRKMEGLGKHYSTTEGKPIQGHSMVQSLYSLLGRHCPLKPVMYHQEKVCKQEGKAFVSKIDMMIERIKSFEPVPGTKTYVLLDSWYSAKTIWKAVRERDFHIVCGLKSNRKIKCKLSETDQAAQWHTLSEYAASLKPEDYQRMDWPGQQSGRQVYVHVLTTKVRKLYRCQLIIVRDKLSDPLSEAKFFACSDLKADRQTLLTHIAERWDIEVLFGDTKELLGLDQYQMMSETAIVRFWTLVMLAYTYLDQLRVKLEQERKRHVTIGEARREVQHVHYKNFIEWIMSLSKQGETCQQLCARLAI